MPRFVCKSCTAGLYSAARAEDLIDPRCPTCGASCASIRSSVHIGDHQRIASRFEAFMERGRTAQARLDADRWLDDGGSFRPAALAAASAIRPPLDR